MDEVAEEKFDFSLLGQRKIYLRDRIDYNQVNKIAKMLLWLDNNQDTSEISLYIKSKGGNTEAGFDLCDIIAYTKSPITGIVFTEADSIAALVLQVCGKRIMMKHAIIIIHEIDITLGCGWTIFGEEAKKRIEIAEKEQAQYDGIIAVRSGLDIKQVRELWEEEKILSAEEALRLNLIDEII